jgi:DNA-directed RNA polymerase specialized sigma24 family protein
MPRLDFRPTTLIPLRVATISRYRRVGDTPGRRVSGERRPEIASGASFYSIGFAVQRPEPRAAFDERWLGLAMAHTLLPEHLEALLQRLAPDRDLAGERYVELSRRLRTVFLYRKCPDPDDLVREALDRAGRKLLELGSRFEGDDPAPYVFRVAWNVARESFRRPSTAPLDDGKEIPSPAAANAEEDKELRSVCLDRCLERLPEDDRDLALTYYRGEKRAKIQQRATLAHELGVSANALRLRVHRITRRLRQCMFECLDLAAGLETLPVRPGPHPVKG